MQRFLVVPSIFVFVMMLHCQDDRFSNRTDVVPLQSSSEDQTLDVIAETSAPYRQGKGLSLHLEGADVSVPPDAFAQDCSVVLEEIRLTKQNLTAQNLLSNGFRIRAIDASGNSLSNDLLKRPLKLTIRYLELLKDPDAPKRVMFYQSSAGLRLAGAETAVESASESQAAGGSGLNSVLSAALSPDAPNDHNGNPVAANSSEFEEGCRCTGDTCVAVTGTSTSRGPGIFAANDEWTLSDSGFGQGTDTFVRNYARWCVPSGSGRFFIYSSSWALTGSSFRNSLTGAGHTVCTYGEASCDGSMVSSAANLRSNFDGIFLHDLVIDRNVLIDYVDAGGCVYVAAGSGGSVDADRWNDFLGHYDLKFAPTHNLSNTPTQFPVDGHSIFNGVGTLFEAGGTGLTPLGPLAQVFGEDNGEYHYGMYTASGGNAGGISGRSNIERTHGGLSTLNIPVTAARSGSSSTSPRFTAPEDVRITGNTGLIMTHATSRYDCARQTQAANNQVARYARARANAIPVISLQSDLNANTYFHDGIPPDFAPHSRSGEITFRVTFNHVLLTGGHLGCCLAMTMRYLLQQWSNREENLNIYVITPAVFDPISSLTFRNAIPQPELGEIMRRYTENRIVSFAEILDIFPNDEARKTYLTDIVSGGIIIGPSLDLVPNHRVFLEYRGTVTRLQDGQGANPFTVRFNFLHPSAEDRRDFPAYLRTAFPG